MAVDLVEIHLISISKYVLFNLKLPVPAFQFTQFFFRCSISWSHFMTISLITPITSTGHVQFLPEKKL